MERVIRRITQVDGAYVLGLQWLYTWGSGRFVGVGRDAEYVAETIVQKNAKSHNSSERPNTLALNSAA